MAQGERQGQRVQAASRMLGLHARPLSGGSLQPHQPVGAWAQAQQPYSGCAPWPSCAQPPAPLQAGSVPRPAPPRSPGLPRPTTPPAAGALILNEVEAGPSASYELVLAGGSSGRGGVGTKIIGSREFARYYRQARCPPCWAASAAAAVGGGWVLLVKRASTTPPWPTQALPFPAPPCPAAAAPG